MESYTYNSEIRRSILHFMSALDGGVVKRYNKDGDVVDSINVNYIYGPKNAIFYDLVNKTDHTKLPVVGVTLNGIQRDNDRVKDNIVGRFEELLEYNRAQWKNIPAVTPVNLTFNVGILTKYQSDLEQILSNFIPYSNPYFVVSWREPFTGFELRSPVVWSGDVALTYPNQNQEQAKNYQKFQADTTFVFKGYMFQDRARDVGKICTINTDYILTDKFSCDYDRLLFDTVSAAHEEFTISGQPRVEYAYPTLLHSTYSLSSCEGIPVEYRGTRSLKIQGYFPNITEVFLSASDPNIFNGVETSSFDIFDGSDTYPAFEGIHLSAFNTFNKDPDIEYSALSPVETFITATVPTLSGNGYVDIIVVNPCGYSKLSVDRRRTDVDTCPNPYSPTHALYDAWANIQDPFRNGIEVYKKDLTCLPFSGGWILENGIWDDDAYWIDADIWID